MQNFPIGIFDSGVGGLSVWEEIVSFLPHESTIYLGDSYHAPYGKRTADEIYELSKKIMMFFIQQHVKLIVIACNTATVSCFERLKSDFRDMPLIGTVPVIKTAATIAKNIGVLATVRTSASHYQKHLIAEFASQCNITTVGTNALVPFIEKGETHTNAFLKILKKELKPFQEADVDVIVLGSTHFAFIEQQIRGIMRKNVQLLDSGAAIARQVKRILEHNKTLAMTNTQNCVFYTTGNKNQFEATAKMLVRKDIRDKIGRVENILL